MISDADPRELVPELFARLTRWERIWVELAYRSRMDLAGHADDRFPDDQPVRDVALWVLVTGSRNAFALIGILLGAIALVVLVLTSHGVPSRGLMYVVYAVVIALVMCCWRVRLGWIHRRFAQLVPADPSPARWSDWSPKGIAPDLYSKLPRPERFWVRILWMQGWLQNDSHGHDDAGRRDRVRRAFVLGTGFWYLCGVLLVPLFFALLLDGIPALDGTPVPGVVGVLLFLGVGAAWVRRHRQIRRYFTAPDRS